MAGILPGHFCVYLINYLRITIGSPMENVFDKKSLIKAMKDMYTVTTQSGPVVPSKTQTIKMLKDQILDPVSAPQDRENWDHRKYDKNKSLETGFNVEDLYKKVVMEATSKTDYHGMRLNLQSIDMKRTHCKFIVDRQGHEALVELYYPNTKGNITAKVTTDEHQSNFYEVPLDSPQFQNNFGFTILKSIDQLRRKSGAYNLTDDLNTQQILNGMGSAVYDVNQSNIQPGAMLRESVDYNLAGLLNICNAVVEAEEDPTMDENGPSDEQAPGAAEFSAPDSGEVPTPMDDMANAGSVNGSDDQPGDKATLYDALVNHAFDTAEGGSDDQIINASGSAVNGERSQIDNLALMISKAEADTKTKNGYTAKLGSDDIYNGFTGLKNKSAKELWEIFFNLDDYSNLKDIEVTDEEANALREYLADPGTSELSLDRFNHKLEELFPQAYGNGEHQGEKFDVDSLPKLDGEDAITGQGAGGADPFGVGGGAGGELATTPDFNQVGGMQDNSIAGLVDQVNGGGEEEEEETPNPLDIGFNEDTGLPSESEDDFEQNNAISNAAASLPGI